MATTKGLFPGPIQLPPVGLYLEGTEGSDFLFGTNYADEIHGRGSNDNLAGGGGDDRIFGEAGQDTLWGEAGKDTLDGGIGNDTLIGGAGADKLIGGEGIDTASYASATLGVTVDLTTGFATNDAAGDTFFGIEQFLGSNQGDIFNGNSGANIFDGGAGDDFLFGQGGHDVLNGNTGADNIKGGAGNDILFGGTGNDTLTGDGNGTSGADHFVLRPNDGLDIITDFQKGIDKIDLVDFGATPFGNGGWLQLLEVSAEDGETMVGSVVGVTGTPNRDGKSLAYNWSDYTLYQIQMDEILYDDYGAFGTITSATALATFTNGVELFTSDFLVV